VFVRTRRKKKHWEIRKRRMRPDLADEAKAIEVRHHHVSEHQVRLTFANGFHCRLAIGNRLHFEL
jgi:hypothetical protein